jgi:glutathione synthase/RimK-type ligase-like ATP-grasp enzyme
MCNVTPLARSARPMSAGSECARCTCPAYAPPYDPPVRRTILLATCESVPELTPSDSILAQALADLAIDATASVWSDHDIRWSSAGAVVLRSSWDYHHRPAEFVRWLDGLERAGVVVWNPVAWVKATMTKTYLIDLARAGWPVAPTHIARSGTVVDARLLPGSPEVVVVKPMVGASSHGISIVRANAPLRLEEDMLVQPFLSEITAGEWSVVAIDGGITHSVLKTPAPGDYRVQRDHGGSAVLGTPPPAVTQLAGDVAGRYLTSDILYARIDIVMTAGGPLLMEVEVIEPELFFELAPESAHVMAKAVAARLNAQSRT